MVNVKPYVVLVYAVLFVNANSIEGQREDMDKITLALLDIRDVLADANRNQDGHRYHAEGDIDQDIDNTVNKAVEFSILVNATTTRLDDLNAVTVKHGDLLAYLLNRVNEMHDAMEAMAIEIMSRDVATVRDDAKVRAAANGEMEARLEALTKGMEERDLMMKRLQENFAAMAKEVLLKDLIMVELRDRLEAVNENLQAKTEEVNAMHENLEALTTEVESLRNNCCSHDSEHFSVDALATATYLVYANNTVRSTDTVYINSNNKTGIHGLKECLPPFKTVGRGCFYIHTGDVRNWEEAREFCRHLRGDLADPADLFSLRAHLQARQATARGFFWLGATDAANPGIWQWVSGAPVSMGVNVWASGQPDGRNQHCLYLDSSKQYKAGNLGCQNHTFFICEYKLT